MRVRQIKNMACLNNCWAGGWARRQSARAEGCCRPDVKHWVLCLKCVCMLCLGLRPATFGSTAKLIGHLRDDAGLGGTLDAAASA